MILLIVIELITQQCVYRLPLCLYINGNSSIFRKSDFRYKFQDGMKSWHNVDEHILKGRAREEAMQIFRPFHVMKAGLPNGLFFALAEDGCCSIGPTSKQGGAVADLK